MKNSIWKKTLINENKSILDVINSLNKHGLKISIILNKKKRL